MLKISSISRPAPAAAPAAAFNNLVEGVNQDDTIYYDKHAGHGVDFDGKLYFVIKASDIVLVD